MGTTADLVAVLKKELKAARMTYAELARRGAGVRRAAWASPAAARPENLSGNVKNGDVGRRLFLLVANPTRLSH